MISWSQGDALRPDRQAEAREAFRNGLVVPTSGWSRGYKGPNARESDYLVP